jgi:hypothetical protein
MSPEKKREGPARRAKPVIHDGVRYEAILWCEPTYGSDPLPETGGAYVVAMDAGSGAELWRTKLYDIRYDPDMERDKQEVYVERLSLSFTRSKLKAVDEKGRKYTLDLKSPEHALLTS